MKIFLGAFLILALCAASSCKQSEYPPPGTWVVIKYREGSANRAFVSIDGRFVKAVDDWIVIETVADDNTEKQFWIDRKEIEQLVFNTHILGPMK